MRIGDKIKDIRKANNMSQDSFAECFDVTRQTISNWENNKCYPDLDMLLIISERFHVSVDELIHDDSLFVKHYDSEKKKKNILVIIVAALMVIVCLGSTVFYLWYRSATAVSFNMKQDKTFQGKDTMQSQLDVASGFYNIPKNCRINISVNGDIDDGDLHILIKDKNGNTYYNLDGQTLNDSQSLQFAQGTYQVQITADNYKENIVSLSYDVKIKN